ncbi:MAG: DUF58 domain-containing protein [Kiritimatiellaeota bacterium]|nr:DUF58 domain-containing protein [Kiritimatiellota bacterium]
MNNAPSYMKFLPGKTTASIGRLEFLARGVVEGFVSGKHRSPTKGFSVEFAEHRQYVPGDDLRNLDWRALARKDRYYIKQYMAETNLRATILLDASGSMGYCGDVSAQLDGKPVSKLAYAQYVAAALTYLLVGQADAVGLVTLDTKQRCYLPAKARASQVRLILEQLERTEAGGDTALAPIFDDIAERIPRRGLVVIVSDLFDDLSALMKAMHHFKFRRHEVILFHIMADEEITFPFGTFTRFRDLEKVHPEIAIDPKTIRASYIDRVNTFLKDLETGCGRIGIEYVPMNTKTPFDRALAEYLMRRRTGGG